MRQQLVPSLHHLRHRQRQVRGDVLHMQALVVLRARLEALVDPARVHAHGRQLPPAHHHRRIALVPPSSYFPLDAVPVHRIVRFVVAVPGKLLHGAARHVQVHVRRLEQVEADLHLVRHGPDDVRADVPPPVAAKHLEPPPDAAVLVLEQLVLVVGGGGASVAVLVAAVRVLGAHVDPLLHFDGAGAVVELVGHVRGLGADVADLADEGQLGDFDVIDLEVGVRVGLVGEVELADGDGADVFEIVLGDGLSGGFFLSGREGGFTLLCPWEPPGWEPDMKPPPSAAPWAP